MSNYNQYYYKGDTINARIADDGVALDLRNDETRSKMYDSNYRLGLAKQLNSLYRRVNGYDSGINDEDLSSEILVHVGLYDFSEGLNGNTKLGSYAKDWSYARGKEANMSIDDEEHFIYPFITMLRHTYE